MSEARPVFDQVNIVVRDMDATLAFYRRLGLDIPDGPGEWPAGSGARHTEATMPNDVRLEFDNAPMARIWHRGWQEHEAGRGGVVFGFSLPAREAVDVIYADLTVAGYCGRQPPCDAFWGARYAIVQDPDGNDVGLMSPSDPARTFTPEP